MTTRRPTTTERRKRTPLAGLLTALVAGLLLAGNAAAQELTSYLPSETFAAVGFLDLAQHEAKFQPFVDEWNRQGLDELVSQALNEADADMEESVDTFRDSLPEVIANSNIYDYIGQEAWFAVSGTRSNPLPAVTVITRVSRPVAEEIFNAILDADDTKATQATEGAYDFWILDEADDDLPLALTLADDLIVLSTNPDTLRGVLRRYQGSGEESFEQSADYQALIAPQLPATLVTYLDLPAVVSLVEPFASGLGFDQSADRLSRALRTYGVNAATTLVTDDGFVNRSTHVLGDPSLDPALYQLLSGLAPVSRSPESFAPAGTVTFTAGAGDPSGWWAYLDQLAQELPELGIGSLNDLVTNMAGVDLNALLFDWMGTTFATATLYTPATEIAVTPDSLLGNFLFALEATDLDAARDGLTFLIQMGGMVASSFVDPMGEGEGAPAPTQRSVAGTNVDTYELIDGLTVELAFVDGYVLVGSGDGVIDAALANHAAGGGLPADLQALAGQVPQGVHSYAVQDGAAVMASATEQLESQMGLFMGLVDTIDFETAERLGDALVNYFGFLAGKMGGDYSYGFWEGNTQQSYSVTHFDW